MMKNQGSKIRILTSFIMSVLFVFILSSRMYAKLEMAMDTTKKIVYENIDAEKILADNTTDSKKARDKYDKNYYLVKGKISEKKGDDRIIVVDIGNKYTEGIQCKCKDKEIKKLLSSYKTGDEVYIYGSIDIGSVTKKVEMKVDNLEKSRSQPFYLDGYTTEDGVSFDKSKAITKELRTNNKIVRAKFFVPVKWEEVEKNIKGEGLGKIEGYQYKLNKLSDGSSTPENLFISYFDNNNLADKSNRNETALIEKAIVENILGESIKKVNKYPKTYYGEKYNYYQGVYRDSSKTYRAEFIFLADGNEGIVTYLYVYEEGQDKHLSEVMINLRLLEVMQ